MAVSVSKVFSDSMIEFSESEDRYDIDELFDNVLLDCAVTPPSQPYPCVQVAII